MNTSFEYARSEDPLYRGVAIDHVITIPVLGVSVRFASNARRVIDIVESAFHAWHALDRDELDAGRLDTDVTIVVHPGDEDGRVRLRHRLLAGHRVLFAGRGNMALVDPERREATAWVTPAFVADTQHFRYTLVEAITMALITPLDRQPFHAAGLVRDDAAVLLAGASGVGKSSLTYAAMRGLSGVAVLAEDAVYLQSSPDLRVWGLPGYMHVPPDLSRFFPELESTSPVVMANGKTKIAVDLRATGCAAPKPFVDRAAVCLLKRTGDPPSMTALPPHTLFDILLSEIDEGFDLFADTIGEPLRKLARNGGWIIELPDDPRNALHWIDRILREMATAAG